MLIVLLGCTVTEALPRVAATGYYEFACEFVTEFFPGAARAGRRRADDVVTNLDHFFS